MSYSANTNQMLGAATGQHGKLEGQLFHFFFTSRTNGMNTEQTVCLTWALSA